MQSAAIRIIEMAASVRLLLAAATLVVLAGCAANSADDELAMTMKEHANDVPIASPMTSYEPAQPVTGEAVVYTTADGQDIAGWLARPENAEGEGICLLEFRFDKVDTDFIGLDQPSQRTPQSLNPRLARTEQPL